MVTKTREVITFDDLAYLGPRPLESSCLGQGFIVSNDARYKQNILKLGRLGKEGSMALFIGGGGTLSMLPDLDASIIVTADYDPVVIKFNQILANAVIESDSPNEAIETTDDIWRTGFNNGTDVQNTGIRRLVRNEAERYGSLHWSQEGRYEQVRAALGQTAWLSIVTDIRNPDFALYLRTLAEANGSGIGFANLTNTHHHIGFERSGGMDFVREWPADDDIQIIFSSHRLPTGLTMQRAISTDEYIELANADML